jgi:MFS transporter, Spinster family, sphingosine-1-phosphate transporter
MSTSINLSASLPVRQIQTAPLPGARTALALLLCINLFNYIDRQVLAALVPSIEKDYFPSSVEGSAGEDEGPDKFMRAKIGLLQTAFMVSYMLIAPIFGWLADRTSRWRLIGGAVVFWSLASAASGIPWPLLTSLPVAFGLLLATRCLVGVGEAAYGPAAPTIISDLYPVQVRGKILAWFYAAIPVGSALGYVLGGLAIWVADWHWAFYSVLLPGLALAVACFCMPEPPRGHADLGAQKAHSARLRDLLILARTPSYVLDTLGMTAMTFALGGLAYWMPEYIVDKKAVVDGKAMMDLGQVNLYFGAIIVVSGLVATLLGGMLGDKLRTRFPGSYFLVSGISMIVGFPMICLVLLVPYPWFWVFIFVACFCLFFNTGPTNTILANVTHPAMRATAFAVNILILHALGDASSPAIIGFISSLSSLEMGFVVVSLMVLVGGILWLVGARFLARDTALAPGRL